MRVKSLPLVVLVTAVAALVISAGWAVPRTDTGSSMMGGYGSGMMSASMMNASSLGDAQPVTDLAAARRQARRFAERLDLTVGEVMQFSRNFYAELRDRSGRLATEVLVDPASGSVSLEYGPAMMWNTSYGMMADLARAGSSGMMDGSMMGGVMDGSSMTPGAGMMPVRPPGRARTVSAAEARVIAQRWLDRNADGVGVAAPEAFPGYYTAHTVRDGRVAGMLSVNATSGAVWFHWWHGRFVSMSE